MLFFYAFFVFVLFSFFFFFVTNARGVNNAARREKNGEESFSLPLNVSPSKSSLRAECVLMSLIFTVLDNFQAALAVDIPV